MTGAVPATVLAIALIFSKLPDFLCADCSTDRKLKHFERNFKIMSPEISTAVKIKRALFCAFEFDRQSFGRTWCCNAVQLKAAWFSETLVITYKITRYYDT